MHRRAGPRQCASLCAAGALLVAGLGSVAGCTPVPGSPSGQTAQVGEPTPSPTRATTPPSGVQRGRVTHIVDGDTIDVAGVGRIRVIGIDTPERGECGFDSATLAMAALVNGRVVTLVSGATEDADRYGRLLRYVDVGSVDAGLQLVEQGWAIARYDSRDGYGHHPREERYIAADAAAEDLGCYPD